jgi:hypothetical protein
MPQTGFELTILMLERPKNLHALDCAVTVTGFSFSFRTKTPVFQLLLLYILSTLERGKSPHLSDILSGPSQTFSDWL